MKIENTTCIKNKTKLYLQKPWEGFSIPLAQVLTRRRLSSCALRRALATLFMSFRESHTFQREIIKSIASPVEKKHDSNILVMTCITYVSSLHLTLCQEDGTHCIHNVIFSPFWPNITLHTLNTQLKTESDWVSTSLWCFFSTPRTNSFKILRDWIRKDHHVEHFFHSTPVRYYYITRIHVYVSCHSQM